MKHVKSSWMMEMIMSQFSDKYPNADTSPERLAEIKSYWLPYGHPDKKSPGGDKHIIRDLLAMLQERGAANQKLMRQAEGLCDRCGLDLADAYCEKCFNELRQQLHDRRWRRFSEEVPPIGLNFLYRSPTTVYFEVIHREEGYMYFSRAGGIEIVKVNPKQDWWCPIPALPKE